MRYRAVFTDPAEKAKESQPDKIVPDRQIMGNDYPAIERWAESKLAAGGPDSYVSIYETSETLRTFKTKKSEPYGTNLPQPTLPPVAP